MFVRSFGLGLLAAATALTGVAQAQGAPTSESSGDAVAILPLEVVGNVPAGRPALEAAVVRGLTMFTGTTVEATQTSARLIAAGAKLPCEDAACWTAAGKAVGAKHLVAGRVERKGENFEVQFRLFDGASGRLLATESNKCEAADCSVAELTRQTVRELARTMLSGTPSTSATGGIPPSAAGAANTGDASGTGSLVTAPVASVEASSGVDAGPSVGRRMLPYVAVAAGVGTLGVGAWLIRRDGTCKTEATIAKECNTWRETMWEGVTATGVGAALLATGVVIAITDHQDAQSDTAVAIGPRSVTLSGRF